MFVDCIIQQKKIQIYYHYFYDYQKSLLPFDVGVINILPVISRLNF